MSTISGNLPVLGMDSRATEVCPRNEFLGNEKRSPMRTGMEVMSHTWHRVYVHVVWSTWQRQPMLTESVLVRAWSCIRRAVDAGGAVCVAVGGTADHVHLLVRVPPAVSLASVVKRAKGATSHLIGEIAPELGFRWQEGYGAFSVDPECLGKVEQYIANQAAHHNSQTTIIGWEPDSV